jgi:3-oxoacyl-[acyl-carrier protein] reductase
VNLLEGKLALVTGASRGIGRGIAVALARAGATVAGTSTTEAGAASVATELSAAGCSGTGVVMNVNDAVTVDAALATVQKQYGDIAILVNNAGVTRDNLLLRMKDEEWDDIMATDLKSVYRLSKAVLRGMMKARYGRIINVTSVVGAMGNAGQANYAASKAGLLGLTKSIARELASRSITCNAVAPGFITTDMTGVLPEAVKTGVIGSIPLGRFGLPEEIASAVAFLASSEGAYITGQCLTVDGGMVM